MRSGDCVGVEIPARRPGCAVHLFGVIKIRDGSQGDAPVILVKKGGTIVRTLSSDQLAKSPADEDGCHRIRIK